jgi:hypothetical protein
MTVWSTFAAISALWSNRTTRPYPVYFFSWSEAFHNVVLRIHARVIGSAVFFDDLEDFIPEPFVCAM